MFYLRSQFHAYYLVTVLFKQAHLFDNTSFCRYQKVGICNTIIVRVCLVNRSQFYLIIFYAAKQHPRSWWKSESSLKLYCTFHVIVTRRHQLGSRVVRVFAPCLGGPGSIPGRVKPTISNWQLKLHLLSQFHAYYLVTVLF